MRLLYVICEGDDDERFFQQILRPRMPEYDDVRYFQYGQVPHEGVRNLLHSIHGMRQSGIDADYVFLRDFDQAPCKESRLDEIQRQYNELVEEDRTYLVVQMIESWYVAGLANQHFISEFGVAPPQTNDFVKRDFENLLDEDAVRTEVLQEILSSFSVERARHKNLSFDYFCTNVLD